MLKQRAVFCLNAKQGTPGKRFRSVEHVRGVRCTAIKRLMTLAECDPLSRTRTRGAAARFFELIEMISGKDEIAMYIVL